MFFLCKNFFFAYTFFCIRFFFCIHLFFANAFLHALFFAYNFICMYIINEPHNNFLIQNRDGMMIGGVETATWREHFFEVAHLTRVLRRSLPFQLSTSLLRNFIISLHLFQQAYHLHALCLYIYIRFNTKIVDENETFLLT